jgi:hypothetical protein
MGFANSRIPENVLLFAHQGDPQVRAPDGRLGGLGSEHVDVLDPRGLRPRWFYSKLNRNKLLPFVPNEVGRARAALGHQT